MKEEVVGGDQESKRRESELMNVLQGPSTYRQRVRETKHRRSIVLKSYQVSRELIQF